MEFVNNLWNLEQKGDRVVTTRLGAAISTRQVCGGERLERH